MHFSLLLSLAISAALPASVIARKPPPPAKDGVHAPASQRVDRVYTLLRLNGSSIPGEVEFASTAGSRHWLRVEESILRLRRDGTFAASARFYRRLLPAGAPRPQAARMALLTDRTQGRYTVRGDSIFFQVPRRGDMSGGIVAGVRVGDRIRVRHVIVDGNMRHTVNAELRVDPTIW